MTPLNGSAYSSTYAVGTSGQLNWEGSGLPPSPEASIPPPVSNGIPSRSAQGETLSKPASGKPLAPPAPPSSSKPGGPSQAANGPSTSERGNKANSCRFDRVRCEGGRPTCISRTIL